ncbi:hypothetical protein M1555_03235 [Patescibacteria group bacterium]|nr:hypothetical protein [Patescibacteria group bacterium]
MVTVVEPPILTEQEAEAAQEVRMTPYVPFLYGVVVVVTEVLADVSKMTRVRAASVPPLVLVAEMMVGSERAFQAEPL